MVNTSDFLVSHSLSSNFTSSQLQVGVSGRYLVVLLKTEGEVYTSQDQMTLYFKSLYKDVTSSSKLSVGEIIGIVVGSVIGAFIIILTTVCCCVRNYRNVRRR